MTDQFNFDFALPLQPDTTLDPKVYKELQRVYNSIRIVAAQIGGGNLLSWQEASPETLADIQGWSSLSTTQLFYRYLTQDTILVSFKLEGISDSTSVQIPLLTVADALAVCPTGLVEDNSIVSTTTGMIVVTPNSQLADIYIDAAGTAWTATGNKSVAGQFIYRSKV